MIWLLHMNRWSPDHIRVEFKSRDKAANVIEMYVMYGDVAAVITGTYFDPD